MRSNNCRPGSFPGPTPKWGRDSESKFIIGDYDVAIVGLGALGSAAAYYASLKDKKVIGFEQFELGHIHGSSHDTSRIVRTSNWSPELVQLARSAYKDWADLEKVLDQKLLTITGGVVFLPDNGPSLFKELINTLDITAVPYELLSPNQVKERWPQFDVPDGVTTIYTADSGIVHASKSVAAMQHLAKTNGAKLKENTRVDRLRPQLPGEGVVIETSNGMFRAKKVILATDAWTNKLLGPLGHHIPLSIMQEQVTYFKPTKSENFQPDTFPVWIWGGETGFYGFPSYGEPSIKAGRDTSNNFMNPNQRTYVPSETLSDELSSFLKKLIPDEGRQPLRTVTCQYTITPDRQFIISPLKTNPDIILGLGAAHAFKFAPAFGRVLAELAIDGKTDEDISKFVIPEKPEASSKL